MTESYAAFLERKSQLGGMSGFAPLWMPAFLFDFQQILVDWAIQKGKAAIFADCGLGKTPMQLVWAENVVRKTKKPVLILTPLAVSFQTVQEGAKFDIECARSVDGKIASQITVTNYEKLHYFSPADFAGVVCDESACIKDFDGTRRKQVTEFLRQMPYRLLCTATAAPNDFTELGTASEAIGELGLMDMLNRFFKNQGNTSDLRGRYRGFHMPREYEQKQWRFKAHAETPFWQWVCSWARACRKPSDLGCDDARFVLPPLAEIQTVVAAHRPMPEFLFEMPAVGLREQREELRHTLKERCEMVAAKVEHDQPAVAWCHLNDEADLLESLIPGARQVKGHNQSDEEKEELFQAFSAKQLRVLITKPKIGAWGLNWPHCAHMTMFPSHSWEQYYQSVRRAWRFGQQREVVVDLITTEGQQNVLLNLQRKAKAADVMFARLMTYMYDAMHVARPHATQQALEIPAWL